MSAPPLHTPRLIKRLSVALCAAHPDTIFVFGDNLIGKGRAGQAQIRDCTNAFGIPTKRLPSLRTGAFFEDRPDEFAAVEAALRTLYRLGATHALAWPEDGLGTGLARMAQTSPRLFAHMNRLIAAHFRNPYAR